MKSVLLIGLGDFGKHVAEELNMLGHEVMAVDIEERAVEAVLPYVDNAQIADASRAEFLESLGVRNFDLCIVGIANFFQSSLEITSSLKEMGARMVISLAGNSVHAKFLLRNGADEIVYPEKQLAAWTAIRYTSDNILDYIKLSEEYAIYEVEVPASWIGKTVLEVDVRKKYNINLLGIRVDGELDMQVCPDTRFEAGNTLMALGQTKDVYKCFKL